MKINVDLTFLGVSVRKYDKKIRNEKGEIVGVAPAEGHTAKFVNEETTEVFEFYVKDSETAFVGLHKYQECKVDFNVEPYQGNINVRLGTVTAKKIVGGTK